MSARIRGSGKPGIGCNYTYFDIGASPDGMPARPPYLLRPCARTLDARRPRVAARRALRSRNRGQTRHLPAEPADARGALLPVALYTAQANVREASDSTKAGLATEA
jgi:hypothetical protein